MNLRVQTYSGYKADERPVSFILDGQEYRVDRIIDSWIGEEHDFWKVEVFGDRRFLLKRQRVKDCWEIEI